MSEQFKLTESQRIVGDTVADFMLYFARPFYWHAGAQRQDNQIEGGTAFIVQFGGRYIGITADHVIEAYLGALRQNPGLVCQLSSGRISPERNIIARSAALDIATFSISAVEVATYNANTIDCTGAWPPPEVAADETVSLAGYPEHMRVPTKPGHMDFPAWGALLQTEDVSDREIICTYDPKREFAAPWAPEGKPPLGYNLSGSSGGPVVLHKAMNGIHRMIPVGVVIQGPTGLAPGEQQPGDRSQLGEFAGFDRFRIRRLSCMREDGTIIDDASGGWLP